MRVRILHILNDGEDALARRIIAAHAEQHEVCVVDLRSREISYERLVEAIFAHDKVVSW